MPPTIQKESEINSIRGVTGQVSVSAPDPKGNISINTDGFTGLTTDNLTEGVTNFYFTNERVDDRVAVLIQNGTGITWSYDDAAGTLTPTVTITQYTDEMVDDRVSALIQDGTGITWAYDDTGGTLTATVSLVSFSTSDLTEGSNLYYTDERVDDRVNTLLQDGGGVTWTYDDSGNTLTPAVDHGSISGLEDDDHTQYYNDTRIESWYDTKIKERGSATLLAGTVTVTTANAAAGDLIILTARGITDAGMLGVTISDGVSFTIDSSNASDARTIDYAILD